MFEILKALMALSQACQEQDHDFNWVVATGLRDGATLKVDVAINVEDVKFIEEFRQLVGA